jgi:hypothetical protein
VLLYDELLYIHPDRLDAQVNVASLKEDVRVRARGYWFRQNPKNQLDQYDTFLIKRFTDPETALGQSFSQRVNDRMQMKPLKINDWLRIR